MRATSSAFSEGHFDAKASRYQGALQSYPFARTFELLPFMFLANDALPESTVRPAMLADMLCGGGCLTDGLQGCFDNVVGIDVSARMLSYYPRADRCRHIKAPIEQHADILREHVRPSVIASLAGLHHIYELENGRIDIARSRTLQAAVLRGWVDTLPAGGCLIVADVTDPKRAVQFSCDRRRLKRSVPVFERQFGELASHVRDQLRLNVKAVSPTYPDSVAEYVEWVTQLVPDIERTAPAKWFHEVVVKHGQFGHDDLFPSPSNLIEALVPIGYDVTYHELPTPWCFPTLNDCHRFLYELFAFGPPLEPGQEPAPEIRRLLDDGAREYLGIRKIAGEAVMVGWRLGYYVVRAAETLRGAACHD